MNRNSGFCPWGMWFFCMTVLSIVLFSCNPREPGCLDVDAENFDFSAEKHDQESCVYPDLLLNVSYKWGDDNFSPGGVFVNGLGQVFSVEAFHMLFGQFVLTDGTGERWTIDQQLEWYLEQGGGETITIPDDFVLVDRSKFDYRLGEIRRSGRQESFQFTLGVPDTLVPMRIDSLPETHVLRSVRVVYDEIRQQFNSARFVINRDTSLQVLDTLLIFSTPETFDFSLQKDFVQGRDDTVRITVDLLHLFQNTDLTRTPMEIVEEIADVVEFAVSNNN